VRQGRGLYILQDLTHRRTHSKIRIIYV
jgi:hypothetical protein